MSSNQCSFPVTLENRNMIDLGDVNEFISQVDLPPNSNCYTVYYVRSRLIWRRRCCNFACTFVWRKFYVHFNYKFLIQSFYLKRAIPFERGGEVTLDLKRSNEPCTSNLPIKINFAPPLWAFFLDFLQLNFSKLQ